MTRAAVVLLAAGGSRRLGRAKQSLVLAGRSLLKRAAMEALASSCRPVVVVLGAEAESMARELEGLDVTVVVNDAWERGMGTSLRAGVAAAHDADALVVMLCDQPLVTARSIDALVDAHASTRAHAVAARYAGVIGAPALFDRALFDELRSLPDDAGAKRVLERAARADLVTVEMPEAAADVDTEEDWARVTGALDDDPSCTRTR